MGEIVSSSSPRYLLAMQTPKKEDLISYRKFNKLKNQETPLPSEDSPGDSADDEMDEMLLGMDYDEESLEDLNDIDEEVLADHPAELEDDHEDESEQE